MDSWCVWLAWFTSCWNFGWSVLHKWKLWYWALGHLLPLRPVQALHFYLCRLALYLKDSGLAYLSSLPSQTDLPLCTCLCSSLGWKQRFSIVFWWFLKFPSTFKENLRFHEHVCQNLGELARFSKLLPFLDGFWMWRIAFLAFSAKSFSFWPFFYLC